MTGLYERILQDTLIRKVREHAPPEEILEIAHWIGEVALNPQVRIQKSKGDNERPTTTIALDS